MAKKNDAHIIYESEENNQISDLSRFTDYLWRLFTCFSTKSTVAESPVWDFGLLSNPEKSGQVYLGTSSECLRILLEILKYPNAVLSLQHLKKVHNIQSTKSHEIQFLSPKALAAILDYLLPLSQPFENDL